MRKTVMVVLGMVVMSMALPAQAAGKATGLSIVPINGTVDGKTYGEWAATWWQWATTLFRRWWKIQEE